MESRPLLLAGAKLSYETLKMARGWIKFQVLFNKAFAFISHRNVRSCESQERF